MNFCKGKMNIAFRVVLVYSCFAVLEAQEMNAMSSNLKKGICGEPFVRSQCIQSPFITESYWYNQATNDCEKKFNFFVKCFYNGNNFATLDECEKECLQEPKAASKPEPIVEYKNDVCRLPHASKEGFRLECLPNQYRAWSFDSKWNKCKEFTYGGCGGNDNRFNSEEDCNQTCVLSNFQTNITEYKDQKKSMSELAMDFFQQSSACQQEYSRDFCYETDYVSYNYWYNKDTNECEKIYSYYINCEPGSNSFTNIQSCERKCKLKDQSNP